MLKKLILFCFIFNLNQIVHSKSIQNFDLLNWKSLSNELIKNDTIAFIDTKVMVFNSNEFTDDESHHVQLECKDNPNVEFCHLYAVNTSICTNENYQKSSEAKWSCYFYDLDHSLEIDNYSIHCDHSENISKSDISKFYKNNTCYLTYNFLLLYNIKSFEDTNFLRFYSLERQQDKKENRIECKENLGENFCPTDRVSSIDCVNMNYKKLPMPEWSCCEGSNFMNHSLSIVNYTINCELPKFNSPDKNLYIQNTCKLAYHLELNKAVYNFIDEKLLLFDDELRVKSESTRLQLKCWQNPLEPTLCSDFHVKQVICTNLNYRKENWSNWRCDQFIDLNSKVVVKDYKLECEPFNKPTIPLLCLKDSYSLRYTLESSPGFFAKYWKIILGIGGFVLVCSVIYLAISKDRRSSSDTNILMTEKC